MEKLSRAPFPSISHPPLRAAPLSPTRRFPSPHHLPGSETGRLMIEAQPSPIAQRIRRASDGFSRRENCRAERGSQGWRGMCPAESVTARQAGRRRIRRGDEMAAGRRQAQRRERGRTGRDEGEDARRRQRSPRSAGAVRDADRRRTRDRPPQDCGGTGVFSERRGDFGGGTRLCPP